MRIRSTGLGEGELKARVKDLKPEKDLLTIHIETSEPAIWHLRAGLQVGDIPPLIKGFFKLSIILFIFRLLFFKKGKPKEPENF